MAGIRTSISARRRRANVTMARIGRYLKSYRSHESTLLKEVAILNFPMQFSEGGGEPP